MPPKAEPEPGTVWPPQAYDGKVRFDVWETLLDMYMSAKGYTDDMDDKKVLALLQNIGPATLEKIIDWTAPDKPQTKKYKELIDLLKEKFSVSKNLTALRFKFFTEKQQAGQSLQEYLAHMTQLYGQCTMAEVNPQQFGVLAILQGLADDDLRQYLMNPGNDIADMKKVQNLAMNFEQSRRAAKALKGDGGSASGKPFQLNVVGKGYKCGYCGGTHPKGKDNCPAKGAVCNKCGKNDHFAKVGKSGRKQQQNLVEDDEQASLNGIYPFSVLTVTSNHKESVPPVKVAAKLDGVPVTFQHDTGSAVTVISKQVWNAIGKPKIFSSNIELQSYNGKIPVIGQCQVFAEVEKQIKQQWIIVVPQGESLFGRDWIKAFKLRMQDQCNHLEGSSMNKQNTVAVGYRRRGEQMLNQGKHASKQGKENGTSAKDRKQREKRFLSQKTAKKSPGDTILESLKVQESSHSNSDEDKDWRKPGKLKSRKTKQAICTRNVSGRYPVDTVSDSEGLSLREGVVDK